MTDKWLDPESLGQKEVPRGVSCPRCGASFDSGHSFSTHWGMMHEGSMPEGIDVSRTEEFSEKLSKAKKGHVKSEEWRKKISETLKSHEKSDQHLKNISAGLEGHEPWTSKAQTVPETGHEVSSSWEADIDRFLYLLDLDYEYESQTFEFRDGRGYTPDFVAGDVVIEVKGALWNDWDIERAEMFMQQYPQYTYVVVGSEQAKQIPCDAFIPWSERKTVKEVL